MSKILLFIPMYNCEKQILRVLEQLNETLEEYIDEVVIINNRSTDNGEFVVKNYIERDKKEIKISLLRNKENYNLGGSHKVAFQYAIENKFDYVIVLHGDDQGSIKDILPYLENREYEKYDALLGARFCKGSILQGYSLFRTIGNRIFNILFSISMRKRIYDLGAGLNIYRVNSLKEKYYIKYPDKLTFNCYMLLATKTYEQRIKFFPISWREDDQISNVKMFNQALITFKLALNYMFYGKKYLEVEHRDYIVENYTADIICRNYEE